jgi:phosphate starvation-inducible membrane PsiE
MILASILFIALIHWVADFVLQTDEMALNKSKDNYWLGLHVLHYSFGLCFVGLLVWYLTNNFHYGFMWVVMNAILHFLVDYHTSRWTSKLWQAGKRHDFFVVIGLDQLIHAVCLYTTFFAATNL